MADFFKWVLKNKEWFLSGVGGGLGLAVGLALIKLCWNSIRNLRQKNAQLGITVNEETSRFYRRCVSVKDHTVIQTAFRLYVGIQNLTLTAIVIKKHKLRILSPHRHRKSTDRSLPQADKIRYQVAKDGTPRAINNPIELVIAESSLQLDREHKISDATSREYQLFFGIPVIIDRTGNKLRCKLKMQDQYGRKFSCKFWVKKEGY